MNIFINGSSSKIGGGRTILDDFLDQLSKERINNKVYFILVPSSSSYEKYESDNLVFLKLPAIFSHSFFIPIVNIFLLPRLVAIHNCDVIFNLADIPIPSNVKQIFLFDWPYAIYPESPVWNLMGWQSFIYRKIKLAYFNRYVKFIDTVIAQTSVVKYRLDKTYEFKKIIVLPNAVTMNYSSRDDISEVYLGEGFKLFYPSYFYSHKNFDVIIPLAKKIFDNRLDYKIVITIDAIGDNNAKYFMRKVILNKLDHIIVNIGPQPINNMPFIYNKIDALLMPTLLETYGFPYVEAMFYEKSIYTSDLDFARCVCGDAAYYFDPNDANSIYSCLMMGKNNLPEKLRKIAIGKTISNNSLSKRQVFEAYIAIIDGVLNED